MNIIYHSEDLTQQELNNNYWITNNKLLSIADYKTNNGRPDTYCPYDYSRDRKSMRTVSTPAVFLIANNGHTQHNFYLS